MAETQAAKRLREYETIFLVKPDLTDDNVDKLKERVRGIVSREGGKVLRFTVWGKKKTLFPIAKQPRAIYVHASYLGSSGLVAEIERNLKNLDEVTRYISVKLADEVDPETRPVLEDLKLAGDVEETRPGAPEPREGGGFRGDVAEESVGEAEEESSEEA
ncbi:MULTISPECIES: 30S ribosomal protein S6 [Myxococcus]|uniref:30S ribosomal protein S6 n=1 Tax=Myxococcus TaxID=32 RepID=UPI0013D39408|nr:MULTISPECIES: 30S ribosomal protein S6 [Myxococcus]NVJ27710.1 30S ribosomal protein S6 [Myxococcus sp. AM011]